MLSRTTGRKISSKFKGSFTQKRKEMNRTKPLSKTSWKWWRSGNIWNPSFYWPSFMESGTLTFLEYPTPLMLKGSGMATTAWLQVALKWSPSPTWVHIKLTETLRSISCQGKKRLPGFISYLQFWDFFSSYHPFIRVRQPRQFYLHWEESLEVTKILFSRGIHNDSLFADRIFYRWNPIHSRRTDLSIQSVWCFVGSACRWSLW